MYLIADPLLVYVSNASHNAPFDTTNVAIIAKMAMQQLPFLLCNLVFLVYHKHSQGFRTEHLRDEAIEILKRAKEINPDGEFVFMPNGKPIITLTFNKRLKKYCEEVGIPYHSSHKIRFYACSTAYNGENLPQLSRMMGHSQVSTTLHYLRNVDKENTFADVFKNLGNSH